MVSKLSVGYGLSRQVPQFAISCPLTTYRLTNNALLVRAFSRHYETSQRIVVSSTQDHTCAMAEDDS